MKRTTPARRIALSRRASASISSTTGPGGRTMSPRASIVSGCLMPTAKVSAGTSTSAYSQLRIAQAELREDIGADLFSCGGGVTVQRCFGKNLLEAAELAVFRTELMSPFGDAMGFVDREVGNRNTL